MSDKPNVRIWLSEQQRLKSSAEGYQRWRQRNLQWQAVPHTRQATKNARLPAVERWTVNEAVAAGRAKPVATRKVRNVSDGPMYDGAQPWRTLYTRTATLDPMRSVTRSQWRLVSGVWWVAVADWKGVGRWGRRPPPLLAHIYFKKPLFPCKRHIFRCAHRRWMRTELISCLPTPAIAKFFWIRHRLVQWLLITHNAHLTW